MRNDWCVGLASSCALQQCQAGARHGCCKGWSCEQNGEDSDCHELGRLLLGELKLCVETGSNIVCVKGGLGAAMAFLAPASVANWSRLAASVT